MKKTKNLYVALLAGILLFSSCAHSSTDETDVIETPETILETESPEPIPAKHEISLEEVQSILAANGLQTNINQKKADSIYHGGQQMRLCHTERGTYAICAKGFDAGIFYVAKIAPDNTVTLLHTGEFEQDGSVPIDIGQDNNGDIVVSSSTSTTLFIYIFDKETDAVTEYSMPYVFGSVEFSYPGYGQTMFDFANRKIYKFFSGGLFTGNYEMEWFTFDLETKTWSEKSICRSLEGIGRHCYLYPVTDGNGGAYIVANRDILIETVGDQLQNVVGQTYLWDELKLFHIPDLTTGENITYTTIQEAHSERGAEGLWSSASNNHAGGIFVDANGYLHVTYRDYVYNLSGEPREFDNYMYYRHAIYDGLECIYNENLELQKSTTGNEKAQIVQGTDGTLYMIVVNQNRSPLVIDIYKAEDELGKTWILESTKTYDSTIAASSISISQVRNGSTQDDIISCFFYSYGQKYTGCVFNISLKDYSITEIVDILDEYGLRIDEKLGNRAYNTAHTTKVVHTANGTYAAFVYDYNVDSSTEAFHIVKIDADKKVTVLYSDSYASKQNQYLTIQQAADGEIYICPPTGNAIYTIDTETDTVTMHKTAKRVAVMNTPQQTEIFVDKLTGTHYVLSYITPQYAGIHLDVLDPQAMTVSGKPSKLTFDKELIGDYSYFYTVTKENGSVYMVAPRTVTKEDLDGAWEYAGYIPSTTDSIMLFYIDNPGENPEIQYVEVQAPYTDEGKEGIWSVANIANTGDVYLDSEGKLHILYTYYHSDFDDLARVENPELIAKTLKHYHAIYDGATLISNEELGIAGLTKDSSVRMAETTDGTLYLLICNLNEAGAKIDVYFEAENEWVLAKTNVLGEFTAESFSISGPRGGSVQDNVIDCIIYATDNDVYYTSISFK